jgi:hypothetical protein
LGLKCELDSYVLLDARGRAFCDELGCLLVVYGSEGAEALKERAEELGHRNVKVVKYVAESPGGLKVFVPKGKVYDEKLSLWYSSYRLAHVELFSQRRSRSSPEASGEGRGEREARATSPSKRARTEGLGKTFGKRVASSFATPSGKTLRSSSPSHLPKVREKVVKR